jgi:4-hydroxy-tetrahydrodipicolinate synthase
MDRRFIGTGVAIITPFKNNKVDFGGLTKVVEHVICGGVDYIVVLGSTGEAAMIDEAEAKEIINHVIGVNKGRVPLVAGNFAGINTKEICNKISNYNLTGIDALLIASPPYVKPSQNGIFEHYMSIAEVSPIPIILYNVPGRTKSNMEWQTVVKLANSNPKFIGIKEASGDMIQANKLLMNIPENFFVVSGDDETALPMVALGGHGVISVIANVYPKSFSQMIKSVLNDEMKKARELNNHIYDFHHHLYKEGNPVGVKAAAKLLGLCEDEVRLPLTSMSKEGYEKMSELINKIKE